MQKLSVITVWRTAISDMIQCCMCFRWHPEQCINDGTIQKDTSWWLCLSYWFLPTTIRDFSDMVLQLQGGMTKTQYINTLVMKSIGDLRTKMNSYRPKAPLFRVTRQKSCPTQNHKAQNLDTSSIRDMPAQTTIQYALSQGEGAKTGDILKVLKEMNANAYADITVHDHTNDCAKNSW